MFGFLENAFLTGFFTGLALSAGLTYSLITLLFEPSKTKATWQAAWRLFGAVLTRALSWGVNALASLLMITGLEMTKIAFNLHAYLVIGASFLLLFASVSIGYWILRGSPKAVFNTDEAAA